MALAGVPARYNKSFGLIRQYVLTFAKAHGGIQYVCGGASRHLFIRFYLHFIHFF
jgi:hypothetical protein